MEDDLDTRAEALFHEVLDLPEAERAAHLERCTQGHPSLRADVVSLLDHLVQAQTGLAAASAQLVRWEEIPERIGEYRIERVLGQGGMGCVYVGWQQAPLERRVAVKVMSGGHDRTHAARFLLEQRTLAKLAHPYIAQVYDAVAAEGAAPYLVMEYVEGDTLPAYCDTARLAVPDRIALFLKVCAGVEHAHRRGIIHRDLKPSNILVTNLDGVATPKIIDFGIAKDFQDDTASPMTATGWLGTPEYMSPEQIEGAALDTRSDVWALGMVLYQLLTGDLPHDTGSGRRSLTERLRAITDAEIPRPSTRPVQGERGEDSAAARGTDVEGLRRTLRSDLDWIVLKALERDLDRRYASIAEFAEDLRRSLRSEPVLARPPERLYVMRKHMQRRPVATAVSAAAIVGIIGFIGMLVIQNQRVDRQRMRAEAEARTANVVVDFLVEMFRQPDPHVRDVETVDDLLALGTGRLNALKDAPEVQSRLQRTMGRVHLELGLFDRAESLFTQSLAGAQPGDARTDALDGLAIVRWRQGKFSEAESLAHHVALYYEERPGPKPSKAAYALSTLALIYRDLGRLEEAETTLRRAASEWYPTGRPWTADGTVIGHNLATVLTVRRKFDAAESLLTEVISTRLALPDADDFGTFEAKESLAYLLAESGRTEEAIQLWQEILASERALLGPDHPTAVRTASNLATGYQDVGRYAEAETLLVEVLHLSRARRGPRSVDGLNALGNLATNLARQGRDAEALALSTEQVELATQIYGAEHIATLSARQNRGAHLRNVGRLDEAETELRQVAEQRVATLGGDHPSALLSRSSLALVLERQHKWSEAAAQHRMVYEGRARVLGANSPVTLSSLHNLIRSLVGAERVDEALGLAQAGVPQGLDAERLLADPQLARVAQNPRWRTLIALPPGAGD